MSHPVLQLGPSELGRHSLPQLADLAAGQYSSALTRATIVQTRATGRTTHSGLSKATADICPASNGDPRELNRLTYETSRGMDSSILPMTLGTRSVSGPTSRLTTIPRFTPVTMFSANGRSTST